MRNPEAHTGKFIVSTGLLGLLAAAVSAAGASTLRQEQDLTSMYRQAYTMEANGCLTGTPYDVKPDQIHVSALSLGGITLGSTVIDVVPNQPQLDPLHLRPEGDKYGAQILGAENPRTAAILSAHNCPRPSNG